MTEKPCPDALAEVRISFTAAVAARAADRNRRLRRRRRLVLATGAALVAVAIAAGALELAGTDELSPAQAAADLAHTALDGSVPGENQFAYSQSNLTATQKVVAGTALARVARPGSLVTVTQQRRTWLGAAHPGWIEVKQTMKVAGRVLVESGGSKVRRLGTYQIGNTEYSPRDLSTLAEHPSRAVTDVNEAAAATPAAVRPTVRWNLTLEPLRMFAPVLPPSVRAALIASIATIPKVTASVAGRTQTFEMTAEGLRQRAGFDTTNAVLTSTSTIVARKGAGPLSNAPRGTLLSGFELTATGVVDTVGAPPKGPGDAPER